MRYTAADVAVVLAYNKTACIVRVTDAGRVLWDLRNMDKDYLHAHLSCGLATAKDFADIKRAVKAQLAAQKLA